MPFKRIAKGKYKSPSGKIWSEKQKNLYFATKGFTKSSKKFKVRRK